MRNGLAVAKLAASVNDAPHLPGKPGNVERLNALRDFYSRVDAIQIESTIFEKSPFDKPANG